MFQWRPLMALVRDVTTMIGLVVTSRVVIIDTHHQWRTSLIMGVKMTMEASSHRIFKATPSIKVRHLTLLLFQSTKAELSPAKT